MKRSFREIIYLTKCVLYTKLTIPSARLVRIPFDCRGKDGIDFGQDLTTGYGCRIEAFSNDGTKVIKFGKNVQINDYVHIAALEKVEIADNVLIASKVFISDLNHGSYNGDEKDSNPNEIAKERTLIAKPIIIGKNVWIGELCSVLPGVKIGENSIIGANSVVTKSIPANSIAVGNPAKVIKQFNFETKRWERI